ncbi:cupin domain-containing protein [Maribellus sediminis]|uniref:cupin domain-containing protein n=1 Tax=Maribellus sediminis TaxID=2696285 RepID=UPI00142F5AA5|nr:cupin domain-containing protein [Maribellus sediminis]
MTQSAKFWIDNLQLEQHPEGAWFKEIYRSEQLVNTPAGERNAGTSIYFLLEGNDFSAFHRIKSDEIWHYYEGTSAIEILWIQNSELHSRLLGKNAEKGECFQVVVPKDCWFAARLPANTGFALVGCTVAPGFHFDDFELADATILQQFSELTPILEPLIRK